MDHKTLNLDQDTIYFVPCTDVHTGPCGVLLYQARHKPLPNKTEQTGELKENEQGGRRRTADSFFFSENGWILLIYYFYFQALIGTP